MKKTHKIISLVLVFILVFSCITVLPASAAVPDAPADPAPACPLLFHNTLQWENIYEYSWGNDGDVSDAWPGKKLSPIGKDDYGYDIYSLDIYIFVGSIGIVINDGKGQQTDDITDFQPEGGCYYLDAEKTVVNAYGATVYEPLPLEESETPTEPATEPTTEPATEPATEPVEYSYPYTIGNADGNETININDVTAIQKYLAKAPVPDTFNVYAADVDQNDEVTISDATLVQYFLAGIDHKDSYCNTAKDGKLSGEKTNLYFSDFLNWGKVSLIARDKNGKLMPNVTVEENNWGAYFISFPVETASLTVVSEDGTKQTAPSYDSRAWGGFGSTFYISWDKSNSQYVLDYHMSGGLIPEVSFINSLNWSHVRVEEWDRYGNLIHTYEPDSSNNKYTVYPAINAQKIDFTDGLGAKTDYITNFYTVPGQGDIYYLDAAKTTVNDEGKTVYVPIKCSDEDIVGVFKFTNTLNWKEVYLYAWNENGNVTAAWPGNKLTDFELNPYGEEVYTIKVPVGAKGIIINSSEGQTDDITEFYPKGGYYLSDNAIIRNAEGATVYVPLKWEYEPSYDDYEGSFYFFNSLGWVDLHIYAYNDEGDYVTAAWPGDKLTDFELNPFGEEVYLVKIPKGATGAIISGKGGQTDYITNFNPDGGSYYLDKNKTTINEFGATVYMPMQW